MSTLNSTLKIGNVEVKNRFYKPAMSEQLADKYGNPKASLIGNLYRRWAQGGVGLMVSGNIMVDRNALGEPSNIVLDNQSDLSAFKAWVNAAKVDNARFFAQLNHPGKQIPKFLDKEPMAPSAVPIGGAMAKAFNPPREMNEQDIERVISLFAQAARLAKAAGFDGIQLHGAHGYLINQFLSPKHNLRSDQWGDPKAFISAVYEAVRKEVGPDYPITVKLNSSDFEKGGYSEDDAISMMLLLEQLGVDAIEVSGGTYESQSMMGEGQQKGGYFLGFARGAKTMLGIPVIVTGGFQSREAIINALNDGVDMVGIGRTLVLDPDMPNKIMSGDNKEFNNRMRESRFKTLNAISQLSWWEAQMLRIARNQHPNPHMHVFRATVHALTHVGLNAFAPRRG